MEPTSFDGMWKDIVETLKEREYVETLSHRVPNRVLKAEEKGIWVRSERTGKERFLPREVFRSYCTHLLDEGTLDYTTDVPRRDWIGMGAIIVSMIALLPYVDFKTRPIVIYLRK